MSATQQIGRGLTTQEGGEIYNRRLLKPHPTFFVELYTRQCLASLPPRFLLSEKVEYGYRCGSKEGRLRPPLLANDVEFFM